MIMNAKDKTVKPLSKGMESFRMSLNNIIEIKLEEIEEAAIAQAIRQMLYEEEEQEQNLQ